ncbi:MAG: hydratase [Methylobacteriaceae bacterium]|nr:hydratase [Rhodoblastus sp.]MCC0005685.1 hydratase [Methylobacteriaceae bacterium]
MTVGAETSELEAIASEALAALNSRSQIATFSSRVRGLSLAQAYGVTPRLRSAFEARGERIVGRKIGFTNRNMWKAFGVESPIWGYVTSGTTSNLSDASVAAAQDFAEPRIEPEIVFGLSASPAAGMSEAQLCNCIGWVALGFEIVQSIYPGWAFAAPDCVAANSLHGALYVGERSAFAPRAQQWSRELARFEVELSCNGDLAHRGGGALVLGSPLHALRHIVDLLAADPANPPLAADEIVSTGTLTLAAPIRPGERWAARASGIPLEDIAIQIA